MLFSFTAKAAASLLLSASLVACVPALAQETNKPVVNEEALAPATPEMVLAGTQKLYKQLREQLKASLQRRDISDAQRAVIADQLNSLTDQYATMAGDIAQIAGLMGNRYFLLGALITYGAELQVGRSGFALSAGGGLEGGVGVFFRSSGIPVLSGVALGSAAIEAAPDTNAVQNRSLSDSGWHIKFLLSNVINREPIVNLKSLEGVYVGGGADLAALGSAKVYAGGCFNRNEFLHDELLRNGTLSGDPSIMNVPVDFAKELVANCNSLIVSFSKGSNANAAPVAGVVKGFSLHFPSSNQGRGMGAGR